MRYDFENNILQDISKVMMSSQATCLFTESPMEKKIRDTLYKYKKYYKDNSGHDCQPPDYYSDSCSLMFDVMRINDSEKRKKYNPVIQQEKKIQQTLTNEYAQSEAAKSFFDNAFFTNIAPEEDYDSAHNYKQYLKQYTRTIEKHIDKIPLCRKLHPKCKHGFMIFDETDLYVECANIIEANRPWEEDMKLQIKTYHVPLFDKAFMTPIVNIDLDFIVWVLPYKRRPQLEYELPIVSIVDLKSYKVEENYRTYNPLCLRSL